MQQHLAALLQHTESLHPVCAVQVTHVNEPSKYGVVVFDTEKDGRIEHFVEKPTTFVSAYINAGLYCFNPSVLDRIDVRVALPSRLPRTAHVPYLCFARNRFWQPEERGVPVSMEKQVFEEMTAGGKLHALSNSLKYWMDIGQPPDYLAGMGLHLKYLRENSPEVLATGDHIRGDVMVVRASCGGFSPAVAVAVAVAVSVAVSVSLRVHACMPASVQHPTAIIGEGCVLGPNVVIGANCVLEAGVRVRGSTLLAGSRAMSHASIKDSIIGWESTVGAWAHVDMLSVLGEHVDIGASCLCLCLCVSVSVSVTVSASVSVSVSVSAANGLHSLPTAACSAPLSSAPEIAVLGAKILPHKGIKASLIKPGTIVM